MKKIIVWIHCISHISTLYFLVYCLLVTGYMFSSSLLQLYCVDSIMAHKCFHPGLECSHVRSCLLLNDVNTTPLSMNDHLLWTRFPYNHTSLQRSHICPWSLNDTYLNAWQGNGIYPKDSGLCSLRPLGRGMVLELRLCSTILYM